MPAFWYVGHMFSQMSDKARVLWIGVPSLLVIATLVAMFFLNHEPDSYNPIARATLRAQEHGQQVVTGYTTTSTLIETVDVLLHKRGGYLTNDIMPPWVFLDNIPNWEYGVLVQVRDLARAMRNDFSRSQTQSTEDPDLSEADPLFHFDSDSWILPTTEGEYRKGKEAMERYLERLSSSNSPDAQFFARADNLAEWLGIVEKRLGSLSQRLSASVGQARLNTDLSGDSGARQSTDSPAVLIVKTPWTEIDDIFYETRGTTWALAHFLHAMEVDFEDVLRKKNALVSFRQIIRELEATQEPLHSPMVLNGSQFGLFANHSLSMANYVSRANAAIIDLGQLLQDG